MLEFHRQPDGSVKINYNSLVYEDTFANLEIDSVGVFTDTPDFEYQRWVSGKRCIIQNGHQQAAPPSYETMVDVVLANLQDIVDAKIDRIALANPEILLSLNPASIVADGAQTTQLTIQLVSGLLHDDTRQNIQQSTAVTIRVTEPNGEQSFDYVLNASGTFIDTYDAVEPGAYQFQAVTYTSNIVELTAT